MVDAKPTLMRRRLGLALRTLRQRAGLSLQEASERLGMSGPPVLSKIENGKMRVPGASLDQYFAIYDVPESRKTEIRRLASLASSGRRGNLLNQYRDAIDDPFADYLELEELANHADFYASQLIPGLLQTEEYAHAVVSSGTRWRTKREVSTFVELRMRRQAVLRRELPLSLWCVLDEAVLRRRVGGSEVLRAQLHHLLNVQDEVPHVQLQVMPFGLGAHAGVSAGSYTVFRFDSGDPVVVVEPLTTSLYLEEDAHVGQYELAFNLLRARALGTDESCAFIRKTIEELS
ncbi:helix-turn-helix transcriptional regulator [Streptomyces sp. ISL-100]|nr:helix-turn-helix transcriptional regulator [Streptomyces sp. ISL-100]